jgi:hypothetical protein
VLEQRIGRVHRLGQKRPVRVVNFVSQGTIEEGMLSLLGFKKSLFAGVLDGGEREVFLGGSRLKRFMETVDRATANLPPQPTLVDAAESDESDSCAPSGRPGSPTSSATLEQPGAGGESRSSRPSSAALEGLAANEPLARVLGQGLALLGQLLSTGAESGPPTAGEVVGPLRLARDSQSGRTSVSFELPPAETLRGILEGLLTALEGK